MAKSKTQKQRCAKTGKRRYRDHAAAVGALKKFKTHSNRDVIPVRSYYCDFCKGHHLTSNDRWDSRAA